MNELFPDAVQRLMDTPPSDGLIEHIPEPYLIGIGKICVAWGTLESTVDICIAKLANFNLYDQRGVIVTAHMSWPQKMDVLGSLVVVMLPSQSHLSAFADVKPLLKKPKTAVTGSYMVSGVSVMERFSKAGSRRAGLQNQVLIL